MKKQFMALLTISNLFVSVQAHSHHSFAAQYDINSPITLIGTVTKIEWTNPHARFYVNVTDDDGNLINWNVELASPNVLKRQGWSRHSLREGDEITIEGSKARSGANMANTSSIILSDGKQVFGRTAADNR